MQTIEEDDQDLEFSQEDKNYMDSALNQEQDQKTTDQETEIQDTPWTSIDMYYRGFHIKKSVPSRLSPEELKRGIDAYANSGFEPSWNAETNKTAKNPQEVKVNSQVPICGIHGTPMVERQGKYGKFFSCPIKNADGSFCKYRPPKENKNVQE